MFSFFPHHINVLSIIRLYPSLLSPQLLGVQSKSFNDFMALNKFANSGASNKTYPAAYHFFEKKRLMEGKEKSKTRLVSPPLSSSHLYSIETEEKFPEGHDLVHDNGYRIVFVGR